jgi:hypothetical protein
MENVVGRLVYPTDFPADTAALGGLNVSFCPLVRIRAPVTFDRKIDT